MSSPEADRPRGIRPPGGTPRGAPRPEVREAADAEARRPVVPGSPRLAPVLTGGIRPPRTAPDA